MARFTIKVRSHGFSVQVNFNQDKQLMSSFQEQLRLYETRWNPRVKRATRTLKCTYATYIPKTATYGLHISLLDDFIAHLKANRVSGNDIEVFKIASVSGAKAKVLLSESARPRDHQPPLIEFIKSPGFLKVLPLQTGGGKTFCTLYSIAQMQLRSILILPANLIEVWLKDAKWIYTNSEEEIIVIQGRKDFIKLIDSVNKKTFNKSIIIISVNTYRDYLTEYEKENRSTYGCIPSKLCEKLKVEFLVVDEADANLLFQVRHTIETNVAKILYLSATLESNDAFTNKIYRMIFPLHHRYAGLKWNKYIYVKALGYHIKDINKINCKGAMGYSHAMFEQSIMRDRNMLANYLKMILVVLEQSFLKTFTQGQKLLIFASTIDMCDKITNYIISNLSRDDITCHSYTSEDEASVLKEYDIIISTRGKAGRGKDIEGLVAVISTVAINAKETNAQMLGRLRELHGRFPGIEPTFYYLTAMNISKHMDYHYDKVEAFQSKAKQVTTHRTAFVI